MARSQIVRVWGKADSFDIEFTYEEGIRWECSVPPDISDGVYAAEIYAMNTLGETAHWCGELFMCNGICHLEIKDSPYMIWLRPIAKNLVIRKGCPHV